MSWCSWYDYMTRVALKSNQESEARLPVLLLQTVLMAPSLERSAEVNLSSAAIAAGVLTSTTLRAQPTGGAMPWYEGNTAVQQVVADVRDGARGVYDAEASSFGSLFQNSTVRAAGCSNRELKRVIKLLHQVELIIYFREHDLQTPLSRCGAAHAPPRAGKARDQRSAGDSLDKTAIKRLRACLRKLDKSKCVFAVIQELTGSAPTGERLDSDAMVKSCIVGHVPWRPSGGAKAPVSADREDKVGWRIRPHALEQAKIRLYFAYHR